MGALKNVGSKLHSNFKTQTGIIKMKLALTAYNGCRWSKLVKAQQ